jgi:hypothetical protein
MPSAFAHPFSYWVGMHTDPRTTPEALAEFNRFYSGTHVFEVMSAHPGFVAVSRYELVEQDSRGGEHAGPRWLAVYEMADNASAEQYLKDNARPWLHRRHYSPWPPARKRAKTIWRMIWRQLSSHDAPLDSILLLGLNSLPEDLPTGRICYELYRAFAHPPPGCPQYCLILPPAEDLPRTDATWRLVYRRISPPD